MSRNQRLHEAIRQSGKSYDDIAEKIGTDPKTVSRWIRDGRLPRPHHRQELARIVGVPAAVLWPDAPGVAYGTSELVGIYTTRRELSPSTVSSLLDAADENIDVLAYAALWLWDTVPAFADRVAVKITQGVNVRICLGDPDSEAVRLRGREEGIEDDVASRCRLAAKYARAIKYSRAEPGKDTGTVRLTADTLYASIFRFDDDVLLNTHLWGNAASDSPVLYFRRQGDDGIAASAIRSFERVWRDAHPL
jgi:transcriptional regulator with XRE-family HTH domain